MWRIGRRSAGYPVGANAEQGDSAAARIGAAVRIGRSTVQAAVRIDASLRY